MVLNRSLNKRHIMLIITRKEGEAVMLGENIELVVVSIEKGQVRIGFKAPADIRIHRKELYEKIRVANTESATNKQSLHLPKIKLD